MTDPHEMTHDIIARELDPDVFADSLPVPTRSATIDWHHRRQVAYATAGHVLAKLKLHGVIPPSPTRYGG